MPWARHHPQGYEVTTQGDRRFSAFVATLADGRTIEQAYQLDVKGYRAVSDDFHEGKGKAPLIPMTRNQQLACFLALWEQWALENPELIEELEVLSRGKVLTDKFATSEINQAHALSLIVDRMRANKKLPFEF